MKKLEVAAKEALKKKKAEDKAVKKDEKAKEDKQNEDVSDDDDESNSEDDDDDKGKKEDGKKEKPKEEAKKQETTTPVQAGAQTKEQSTKKSTLPAPHLTKGDKQELKMNKMNSQAQKSESSGDITSTIDSTLDPASTAAIT